MCKVILDRAGLENARESRSKVKPGVTCVAFFKKQRPWTVDALIHWFHESLRCQLSNWLKKDWVRLAPRWQIHATLIGLEATLERGGLFHVNARTRTDAIAARPMDLDRFAGYLQQMDFPIRVRFGGFSPEAVNPYDSRPPFERTFAIRPDGLIVAIGWPLADGVIQPALSDFRRGAERFQIVHKYHVKETAVDNDAFLVLGAVTSKPWERKGRSPGGLEEFVDALSQTQREIRQSLQTASLEVALCRQHCSVVKYQSADLAGVGDPDILSLSALTAESLRELYPGDRMV